MKMITLQIPATTANALLDATSDPALLKALARALAGVPAVVEEKVASKKAGKKPAKAPKTEAAPRKGRKPRRDAVEDAATVLAHMKSDREYAAETLRPETGLDKAAFGKAMAVLIENGKVTKSGEKRSTRYSVA